MAAASRGRGDEGGAEPERARRLRARDISTATKNGKEKRAGVENNSNLNAEKYKILYYKRPLIRSYPHKYGAGGSIKTNIVISQARGEALAKRARGRGWDTAEL